MTRSPLRLAGAVCCIVSCLGIVIPFGELALARSYKVTIPAGTTVSLAASETLDAERVYVGQPVQFTVRTDVYVGETLVIAAGAPARGTVTSVKKRGIVGQPASIGVQIDSVVAVDGTLVPVRATHFVEGESKMVTSILVTLLCCVLGLLMKGGNAQIGGGTQIEAVTVSNIQVEVSE